MGNVMDMFDSVVDYGLWGEAECSAGVHGGDTVGWYLRLLAGKGEEEGQEESQGE